MARTAGFTLIEALVAIAIIGMALMPLLDLFGGTANALLAAKNSSLRSQVQLNAVEFLDAVNPMIRPQGESRLGRGTIRWTAEPIAPPVDGMEYGNARPGLYSIGLYDVRVSVNDENGAYWFDFTLRLVGHKRVRTNVLGM